MNRPAEDLIADATVGLIARLEAMSPEERIAAARGGGFSRRERVIWAARFPTEATLVNGEFEWIALGSADLD